MILNCPTCGAQVEFRYDDSLVRVCSSCHSSVLRSDRGIESLGKVADVTPIESPLRLFADGKYNGAGFILVGMSQIDHGSGGIWQEWYAKLDGGQWGWLTEAQGRFYMTFERPPDMPLPPLRELRPGTSVPIGDRFYTVGEVTQAHYKAAAGEIPYRYEPGAEFWYADLADGMGGFATIDYNDGSEPPALYVGTQVNIADLKITGGERPFSGEPPTRQGNKIACPNCGGSLELAAPDRAMRVGCPYCNHLVSVQSGNVAVLHKLATRPQPMIPLGTKATLSEGEMTVIGYVQRSAYLGSWYTFDEYLLFRPELGFRWLVCSDGHWSYVQPIAPGAVEPGGKYDGIQFKLFQIAEIRVDCVLGEFYWEVEVGERVVGEDYINPPAMLSCESSQSEQQWSLSSYLTRNEVMKAVPALAGQLAPPRGTAGNQPYSLHGVGVVAAIIATLMLAAGLARCGTAKNTVVHTETFSLAAGSAPPLPKAADETPAPTGAAPEPAGHVQFSKPFELKSGKNIEIDVEASINNNWAYMAVDVVNEKTGHVVSYDANLEYYQGVEDGESWSEGSLRDSQVLGPPETGTYIVRIESQHGSGVAVPARITVRQDVFRSRWWFLAAGIIAIPFLLMWWHYAAFHKRKWNDAQLGYLPPGEAEL